MTQPNLIERSRDFENQDVALVFLNYPKSVVSQLMFLRELIFQTAAATEGVGEMEETLRWGEPTYLTSQSKIGSMIRINSKGPKGTHYAIYFHCQTNLVETFRQLYCGDFQFEGNRAIVFAESDRIPVEKLRSCIAMALTYHRDKKQPQKPRGVPRGCG